MACFGTNTRAQKFGLNKPARNPILRYHDGTRTTDSVAGEVNSKPNQSSNYGNQIDKKKKKRNKRRHQRCWKNATLALDHCLVKHTIQLRKGGHRTSHKLDRDRDNPRVEGYIDSSFNMDKFTMLKKWRMLHMLNIFFERYFQFDGNVTQIAPYAQFQGNPTRELKIEKKSGKTSVRSPAVRTHAFVVANMDYCEDQLSQQSGSSPRTRHTIGQQLRKTAKNYLSNRLNSQMVLIHENDVFKNYKSKKTIATLLSKEIHKINEKICPNQDHASSLNNRQTEFSESSSKKNFLLLEVIGLSNDKSIVEQRLKENMFQLKEILQVLYQQQGVISKIQETTLEQKILEAIMVSAASPMGWRVILELQTGDTLVLHEEWNKEQKHWTSNKKKIEAIYLGLSPYGQIFKEQQTKAFLFKSDISTTI
ncbi:MAG: hypothetical protein EZS28_018209 [Streblomastix strix]|uniref:Uncharacterized protein n=1 Tax=Streblomastix strix TaxID=222440 RepID=A0A5J4VUR5_9EUKA|nr:MAG: hypothetical protein EZS28_018209 [Streblomastix strix]